MSRIFLNLLIFYNDCLITVYDFCFMCMCASLSEHRQVNVLEATRGHQSLGTAVTAGQELPHWMLDCKLLTSLQDQQAVFPTSPLLLLKVLCMNTTRVTMA